MSNIAHFLSNYAHTQYTIQGTVIQGQHGSGAEANRCRMINARFSSGFLSKVNPAKLLVSSQIVVLWVNYII